MTEILQYYSDVPCTLCPETLSVPVQDKHAGGTQLPGVQRSNRTVVEETEPAQLSGIKLFSYYFIIMVVIMT